MDSKAPLNTIQSHNVRFNLLLMVPSYLPLYSTADIEDSNIILSQEHKHNDTYGETF